MKNEILLTDEAAHAVKCKGPTDKQLFKALLSNEVEPDFDIYGTKGSRFIRWMAAEILKQRGFKLKKK